MARKILLGSLLVLAVVVSWPFYRCPLCGRVVKAWPPHLDDHQRSHLFDFL